MDTYRNFIKGEWVESSSQKSTENVNPANTEDVLGTVKLSTREEARGAVEAAAEAFRGWRATPAPARGRVVARFARLLEENKVQVAALLTREEGKTIGEARGELQRAINVAEFCAG
ncbi:MAG TPA: aldehyde dehydrogenase family protein, partial [Pyrinomonadaceae bacterium]